MKTATRRRFLLGVAGISVTTILGIVGLRQFHSDKSSATSYVEKALRYLLRGEEISDAVIARFAEDFSMRHVASSSVTGKVLNALSHLPYAVFRSLLLSTGGNRMKANFRQAESDIVTAFLLSTDYFLRDVAGGPVTYLQYYDPYESTCQNALAKFDT